MTGFAIDHVSDPRFGRAVYRFRWPAMDPNDNAKYLNFPETELFDNGRSCSELHLSGAWIANIANFRSN